MSNGPTRVYLDQNKWIDLARAYHNRTDGSAFIDTLEMLRYGVEHQLVSLPLSAAHYMETQRQRDRDRRVRLVKVMAELSRFHTIAPPSAVVPGEIEQFMSERYGIPRDPRRIHIFGFGVSHAFDTDMPTVDFPSTLGAQDRAAFISFATNVLQTGALLGPEPGSGIPTVPELPELRHFGTNMVKAEERIADSIAKGEAALADLVTATALMDIVEDLNRVCEEHQIQRQQTPDLDTKEGNIEMLHGLPSRHADVLLRIERHKNRDTRYRPNDLNDIATLSIAVPYCDVVVTEKSWTHHIRRSGLDTHYDTIVLSKLEELPAAIA